MNCAFHSYITKSSDKINLFCGLSRNWFHFINKAAECMLNMPSFTAPFLLPCRSCFNMKYLTVLCITLASMLCFTNADRHWKCGCSCDFYPEPVGDQKNPGFSCKDILENNEAARNYDGIYWITLSGKFGAR